MIFNYDEKEINNWNVIGCFMFSFKYVFVIKVLFRNNLNPLYWPNILDSQKILRF